MNDYRPILEALLLAAKEPLSLNDFVRILSGAGEEILSKKEIQDNLENLSEQYEDEHRGIQIVSVNGGYQFRTKPEFASWVQQMSSTKPPRLSTAAIETMAIIAYRQPLTRSDMESIRGVDSGGVLKSLLERRLIKILGRKEEPGRPLLYGTTKQFLELFGLKDLKELPPLKELEQQAEEILRQQRETESTEEEDLDALDMDLKEVQWLDDKERESIEELDQRLAELKKSDQKTQELIQPQKEEPPQPEPESPETPPEAAETPSEPAIEPEPLIPND